MKPIKYVSNILLLLIAVALISTPLVSAHAYDNLWNVSGWVVRSDTGAGMAGIAVSNASNATETVNTNASGGFILNVTSNAAEHTLSIAATAGYTRNTSVKYQANSADNASRNVTLIVITPAISALTESTPTLTGDTVSWTVTATDGLNNNYVGNRLIYSEDSNLATNQFYSDWSNDSAAPSFALSNLKIYTKYYYQVESYNKLNSAYSATTTGDFTTKSGVSSTYGQTPVPTATTQGGSFLPSLGGSSGGGNNLIILVLIGIVAYYGLFVYGKSEGKKGRKR